MSSRETERREQAVGFLGQANVFAAVCSSAGWQGDDGVPSVPGAKPIGVAQWKGSVAVAAVVAQEVDWIEWPLLGADPDGFIWLTWENARKDRRVALQLRASLVEKRFRWTITRDGFELQHEADSFAPLIEAIKATFSKIILAS